jgi:hypothetical protein
VSTHLSIRLVWHDRGWNGHVSDGSIDDAGIERIARK